MIEFLLHLFFGQSYVRKFKETRPKRGETDAQYAKRLRKLHSWSIHGLYQGEKRP